MATYEPKRTRNFYLLGDTEAEKVQLIESDQMFTRAMGGLLPEQSEQHIAQLRNVLDIGCGPGGWVLEMAYAYPDMHMTGMDISQGMVDYARSLARANGLDNARFLVGNAMDPLDFPENTFDLVNARQIEGVIPTASWPALLAEMFRVSRPGGTIRLTGNEWGVTNSAAYETLQSWIIQGYVNFGLNHAPDSRNYGITTMLSRYLRDVGCVNVQERPTFMDISAGAEQHQDAYNMWMLAVELIEPFFLSAGVTTKEMHAQAKRQLSLEMAQDSFRGIIYTVTAWGEKP